MSRFKRILLLLMLALVTIGLPVVAESQAVQQQQAAVAQMEQRLFSAKFEQEPMENRLKRLEETVYGQANMQLPIQERLARLSQTVLPQQPAVQPAQPQTQAKAAPATQPAQQADDTANPTGEDMYPTVTAMEQELFGRNFRTEGLSHRLERLELKRFKKAQSGSLSARVDRLNDAIMGRRSVVQDYAASAGIPGVSAPGWSQPVPGGPTAQDWNNADQSPSQSSEPYAGASAGQPQTTFQPDGAFLAALGQTEKRLMKQNFPTDSVQNRLARMEMKVFNMVSPGDFSPEERLERLDAVSQGGGDHVQSVAMRRAQQWLPFVLMLVPLFI